MADSHAPDAAYEGHLTEDHAHPHGVIFLRNRGSRTAAAGAAGWRAGLRSPWMSAPMILSIEVASNIAYFSVYANMVIYLTAQLAQPPPRAAAVANGLTGAAYVCVVLGGYLADATWGRGVTLLVAGSMLVGGLTVLTVSSLLAGRGAQGAALGAFFASQLVTALAFGGIKPNVSAMGADQFDDYDAKGRPLTDKERFFTWYYFFINLGALLASTVLVYVQTNVSWTLGFALPTAVAGLALLAYTLGWRGYRRLPPGGPPVSRIAQTFALAYRNRRMVLPDDPLDLYEAEYDSDDDKAPQPLHHTDDMAWLDKAAVVPRGVSWPLAADPVPTDFVPVTQVEETKQMVRLMPLWCTLLVWNLCYAQMASIMVQQAEGMDRKWGSFVLPPASVLILGTLTILGLVPLYDRVVLPMLESKGWAPTSLQRGGLAQLWMGIAMLVACVVWLFSGRLRRETSTSASPNTISVVWMFPQMVAIGVSEFFYIGLIEFFYQQAPVRMRSLTAALALLSFGIASFAASGVIAAVGSHTDWLPGKGPYNQGRLERYYALLAGLAFANTAVFCWPIASRYTYREFVRGPTDAPGFGPSITFRVRKPEGVAASGVGAKSMARTKTISPYADLGERVRARSRAGTLRRVQGKPDAANPKPALDAGAAAE